MIWKYLSIILASFVCSACTCKVVCYYSSWAIFYPGPGRFAPENIEPYACTHLIYAFIGINANGTIRFDNPKIDLTDNGGMGSMKKIVALKKQNPNLKVMVSIGGWNEGSDKFSAVAADPGLRERFVRNIVQFLKKFGFDGLDVDWEYPNQNGGRPADYKNFIVLLTSLRTAFDPHRYILSAAVGATESDIIKSYDVRGINDNVHFINLMSYDYHGTWDGVTGHNAPLNGSRRDRTNYQRQLNVRASVEIWLRRGASPDKLIMGIPLYSRTSILTNATNHAVGAPIRGPGNPGPYTRASGTLSYMETFPLLNNSRWIHQWDPESFALTLYYNNQFISTENMTTIGYKLDFASEKHLGGVMLWSIDQDHNYEISFFVNLWCAFRDIHIG